MPTEVRDLGKYPGGFAASILSAACREAIRRGDADAAAVLASGCARAAKSYAEEIANAD